MNSAAPETSVPLIVHVVYRFDFGGLENGLANLINQMPADRYRHAIVCLTNYSEFSKRIQRADVQWLALNKKSGKDLKCYWRFAEVLRNLRPAIVHTRNLGTLDMQFVATACGVSGRVHGEHGWDVYDLNGQTPKYLRLRRWASRVVRRYIAMSQDLAAYLQHDVHVPKERIHQIYNGVDSVRFRPKAPQEKAPWPDGFAPAGTTVIGTVGRLEPVKNPLGLVRGFARLVDVVPSGHSRLRLVLVGAGPMQAEVQQAVNAAGIADITWLAGGRNDVPELMRHFDIFALPSLNEGISNTILEAMASGIPVVASDVGGNPEIVRNETGSLYPVDSDQALATSLVRYVGDVALRREHGARARENVEQHHSLDAMVNNYLQVYDSSLNGQH